MVKLAVVVKGEGWKVRSLYGVAERENGRDVNGRRIK